MRPDGPGGGPRLVGLIVALLFGVPWWTLVGAPGWPVAAVVAGTAVAVLAAVALPFLMVLGHGRRQRDAAARVGDTLLGVIWVLFAWSVLGLVAGLVVGRPDRRAWPSSPWRWCWWSTAWSRPGGCRGCGRCRIDRARASTGCGSWC